jgi:hypothetical protein
MIFLLLIPLLALAQEVPPEAASAEQALPMRFANLPVCPAAGQTSDLLLLEARDGVGFAVEIWCAKQATGFAYTYRSRGTSGQETALDDCRLGSSINSAGVEHLGTVDEAKLPGGQPLVTISGRILRFFHHNWNEREGRHAIADFRGQRVTVYRTEAREDLMGRQLRLLTSAEAPIPAGKLTLGKLNDPAVFDGSRQICRTAAADDGQRVIEHEVDAFMEPGKLSKVAVAWPESNLIQEVFFEPRQRKLLVRFPQGTRRTVVSLAFPRQLLGIGKQVTTVRLDNRFVTTEETITSTHRTVRFLIDEPAKEALLTESGGFPFFVVSSVAIVGGLIIGTVVALLFRRKLPAVRDDDPEKPSAV